jgi:hypothetical protein
MKNITKYLTLTDLFQIKNKKWKIVEYTVGGILLIYVGLICYPNLLFAHSIKYRNFTVYSTKEIDGNIHNILDKAEINLSTSDINNTAISYKLYLCNNYSFYSFFAPKSRKAFANNYSIVHNIFISNCDIRRNEAYKNDERDNYVRQLSELIAHEATHTLTEKKLGFWKYLTLERWINEGYSETIGYNEALNIATAKEFLKTNKNSDSPSVSYKKYYYAVAYILQIERMKFEEIIEADLTLDDVLNKIETIKTEK